MLDIVSVYFHRAIHSYAINLEMQTLLPMGTCVYLRYMAREVKEKNKSVGFLNPDQVNGNRIELEPEEVEAWLVNEMVAQQDKEYIFLPYIQE